DATAALEFGPVGIGASAVRSFTVQNTDATPTSQLRVRIGAEDGTFSVTPTELDLGPGERAPVDVAFNPNAVGHRSSEIVLVASATNQSAVHMLSHGYGGDAPANGTGPLPIAHALFFNTITSGTFAIRPD